MSGQAEALQTEQRQRELQRDEVAARAVKPLPRAQRETSDVARDNPVPLPPFWGRRQVTDIPVKQIFPYLNPNALFIGQWGFKKKGLSEEQYDELIEQSARPVLEALQQRAVAEGLLDPKVVYGYFPVQSQGDDLIVYHTEEFAGCACHPKAAGSVVTGDQSPIHPHGTPREWLRFTFPRQELRRRLCISDFFRSVKSGQFDVLGFSLVTVGDKASQIAQELFAANKYQEYLYLHGFGVESAEALAEFWHKRMRQEMGFGSEDSSRIVDLFHQAYRGGRYSFGYGACPSLEDRAKVVQLLAPESIGVVLSENFMLVPEQSTDALIVHHPQAKYFDT
jgi:5-methyltetrahydrofolate--homocysteine methyltransferase